MVWQPVVWKATHAAMSVGKADGSITRQINGVAAGSLDSDAVNVAQLKMIETAMNEMGNSNNAGIENLQGDINNIRGDVNNLRGEIGSVGAMASAMAGLHPRFQADNKGELAMAFGQYAGKSAVAVGGFYAPNKKLMFSLGLGIAKGGSKTGNIGMNIALGRVNKMYTQQEGREMAAKLQEQSVQIQSLFKMLAEQSQQIKSLKEAQNR